MVTLAGAGRGLGGGARLLARELACARRQVDDKSMHKSPQRASLRGRRCLIERCVRRRQSCSSLARRVPARRPPPANDSLLQKTYLVQVRTTSKRTYTCVCT